MASTIAAGTTSGTAIAIAGDTSGVLQLQTNGTTAAVTIDTSQNVGINKTSPATKLNIGFTGVDAVNTFRIEGSNGSSERYAFDIQADGANTATKFLIGSGGGAPTERMRIDSSGRLLVNLTGTLGGVINSYGTSASAAYYGKVFVNGDFVFGVQNSSGTVVGGIVGNSSTTSYNTSSDYRLKENIAPMTGALATVTALKPCTYKWKLDGKDGQGFIAHELQAIVPDAVSGEKDAVETYTDEDGNEQTRIKAQGVDTSFLVATLTSAIQELKAVVDAQAVRIAELEGAK